ncbi:DUF357 domain-containing protein [Methanonatronarchaeum sp. AMET-Sl]|uniref:DUF357 domain-containing protein n=1 Tax=Methanonatronarchaeum sp. AMET-Sl TaxID=3037654 RepID=UPI00244DADF2|nr:DUF357 domain-containing protein [Methanonatronarchaeum sp. AMET-Sl]WGI16782.1 DUF357 domain-containing protein [Methanonatronarchaeum sp. AMET-Sl]
MTEQQLINETDKWQSKLKKRLKKVEPAQKEGERFIENITAYLKDSNHFIKQNDYVRAFECVIWGWAWLEIGEQYNYIKKTETETETER